MDNNDHYQYIIIAALLSTVISYLWLQIEALRSWQGMGVLLAAIPFMIWSWWTLSFFSELRISPDEHKFWYVKIAFSTICAAASLFVFSWTTPKNKRKTSKNKVESKQAPAPESLPQHSSPLAVRQEQLFNNLIAISQKLDEKKALVQRVMSVEIPKEYAHSLRQPATAIK